MPADSDRGPAIRSLTPQTISTRLTWVALAVVLVVAGVLRLAALATVPVGLNQDEASNAWNAYCLLKTGQDQFGTPWPIFYTRALGENRSTLFLYWMMPFQAALGLSIWSARVPAAVAGVLAVLLIYWVGARLFGRGTGLAAAALLAVSPVHIQMSRWGHEATLTPLLTLLPFALLLWAGLPLDDRQPQPRPWRALVAGLLTGLCCYGYPAVRLFVPVFLTASVLWTWRAWTPLVRMRRGRLSLAGLVVGTAVTFGPLAYLHVVRPDVIGRRGQTTWIWSADDPAATRALKVAARYAEHFGPDFLFRSGDAYEVVWTTGHGFLPRFMLPLLLGGLAVCGARLTVSRAARVLAAGVLLYPAGDCLNWHFSANALRGSAGLWPLLLLGALGISAAAGALLRRRLPGWTLAAGVALAALILVESGRFARDYFLVRPRQSPAYYGYHEDLIEACEWLRPRLADVDAVLCTPVDFNQPYLITLVALAHDPRQWFAEPREWYSEGAWDRWVRYGKFYFAYEAERARILERLKAENGPKRVMLFLRANEPAPGKPMHEVVGPDGRTALVIYAVRL